MVIFHFNLFHKKLVLKIEGRTSSTNFTLSELDAIQLILFSRHDQWHYHLINLWESPISKQSISKQKYRRPFNDIWQEIATCDIGMFFRHTGHSKIWWRGRFEEIHVLNCVITPIPSNFLRPLHISISEILFEAIHITVSEIQSSNSRGIVHEIKKTQLIVRSIDCWEREDRLELLRSVLRSKGTREKGRQSKLGLIGCH